MFDVERRRIQHSPGWLDGLELTTPPAAETKPKDLAFGQLDTCFFFVELSYDRPW